MKIMVTGASGFIGRNLVERLTEQGEHRIYSCSSATDRMQLNGYTEDCNFVYHLAAVHRPLDVQDYVKVNNQYFADLLVMLRSHNNHCPVLLSSSTQAAEDSAYGRSKLAAENELKQHAAVLQSKAIIYRLTNTFGRYAKPNHHSVVATFCYNIARNLPIAVNEPEKIMKFYYIDDVIDSFICHLEGSVEPDADGFYRLPASLTYEITLQALAEKITGFKEDYDQGFKTVTPDEFTAKLLATFTSYIPSRGGITG